MPHRVAISLKALPAAAVACAFSCAPAPPRPGRAVDTTATVAFVEGPAWKDGSAYDPKPPIETAETAAGIHVFTDDGTPVELIPIREDMVTNCTFGGEDGRTLWVTAGHTLFRVRPAEE